MKTDQVRKKFLDFFESKKHRIVSSDKLVPGNDPSLLFTSAGMNQFKEQFMGKIGDFQRAASSQKCLRTGDLEKVGKTASHHTFFEMLGNFSFGDYFKTEAIQWAWEFLIKDLKIKKDTLQVSVYEDDQEAYDIWLKNIKVPAEKISKFGPDENFWPANAIEDGPNGPCGPCSEIFFDRGKNAGCGKEDCSPACSCGRFVEIWNLVFTQFNRADKGKLEPLPNRNIDTGMGLERMAACMQGVSDNFQIDIFRPIIEKIRKVLKLSPDQHTQKVNCIADHIRAVVFAIGDGIMPSNETRGYVIRKLIRRASWNAYQLNLKKPYLYQLTSAVCDVMKASYPELQKQRDNIANIILAEEERFLSNVQEGKGYLDKIIADAKKSNIDIIGADILFKLYDTYGFPLELSQELATVNNLKLDLAGFNEKMNEQREKARLGSKIAGDIFAKDIVDIMPSKFVGYEIVSCDAQVAQIIKSKQNIKTLKEGQDAWLILDATPFYGESGGQVGDTGVISSQNKKAEIKVQDTKKIDDAIVHIVKVMKGSVSVGDKILAEIDKDRRDAIKRAHTATHLLQSALRKVLGEHVHQAGSLVEPDRFRFDFTHFKNVKTEEIERVQELVNESIRVNSKVSVGQMKKEAAEKVGAIALFGEKYGDEVRVVNVGDYSKEFCGGTHLDCTGNVDFFIINSESSIGSGLRRIEGFTGKGAYQQLLEKIQKLQSEVAVAKKRTKELEKEIVQLGEKETKPQQKSSMIEKKSATTNADVALPTLRNIADAAQKLQETIQSLQNEGELIQKKNKQLERQLVQYKQNELTVQVPNIAAKEKVHINNMDLFTYQFNGVAIPILRNIADTAIKELSDNALVVLSSTNGAIVCRVGKGLKGKVSAVDFLKTIAQPFGGSGGGRSDFAQGGIKQGTDFKKLKQKAEKEAQQLSLP